MISDPIAPISLDEAVRRAGGASVIAESAGISPRAIYKWIARGTLPRTDFTGETQYAEIMADLSSSDEEPFTASELLESLRRSTSAA